MTQQYPEFYSGHVRILGPRENMVVWKWLPFLLILGGLSGAGALGLFLNRLFSRQRRSSNFVLFYPSSQDRGSSQVKETSVEKLFSLLQSAQRTLDVCVFTISNQKLSTILIKAHQRGVVVRVVTDNEQLKANGKEVQNLRRAGIQVRHNNSSLFMHHKFAVIDNKLLLNGSLNWTLQGLHGNQENVLVTTEQNLVIPFIEQFQHLWKMYDLQSLF